MQRPSDGIDRQKKIVVWLVQTGIGLRFDPQDFGDSLTQLSPQAQERLGFFGTGVVDAAVVEAVGRALLDQTE